MATKMQQRRATAAEWAAANPILADGEMGFERDTKIIKVGDGVTRWNALGMPNVVDAVPRSLVDAKGDILVGTADNASARLPVGTDGQVLTADSTTATGATWSAAAPATKAYINGVLVPANTTTPNLFKIALPRKTKWGIVFLTTYNGAGCIALAGPTLNDTKILQVGPDITASVPSNASGLKMGFDKRANLHYLYFEESTASLVLDLRNYTASNDTFNVDVAYVLF